MFEWLSRLNNKGYYWLILLFFLLALNLAALFYQLVLETLPCVLCVQVRAWVLWMSVACLSGYALRRNWLGRSVANLLLLCGSIGLAERVYWLLATERSWAVESGCGSLDKGFPDWLPLYDWFPLMFKPLVTCGFTPWVIPEWLTMAEALALIAGFFILLSGMCLFVHSLHRKGH